MKNKIICGDCIELLNKIDEPFADLIFADPPFNIGYKYDKYFDKVKSKNYIAWTTEWIKACKKILKPNGSFYIAIGDDYAAQVKLIAEELGLVMRNWIIWHYTFGQQTKNKFARSHTHIFYFVNDSEDFVFNDHAVRVPSDRQLIYNDKRANHVGKMPDDVWNQHPRVCGTFKERQGWHPCQMPESLLKTIIAASSNPGHCVLDPFSGSGTTAAASLQMARNYVGIEISANYAKNTRIRLTQLEKQNPVNGKFSCFEINELKRLANDINIPVKEIISSEKLLDVFASQFAVRMNSENHWDKQKLLCGLKELKI